MLGKIRFSPGALVLVRYADYPLWPATVQRNPISGYNRFVDIYPNYRGEEVVAYWVVFSGDQEGGWVPAQYTVPFHPKLAQLARVSVYNEWHAGQTKALSTANGQYEMLHPPTKKRPPVAIRDRQHLKTLLDLYHRGDHRGAVITDVEVNNYKSVEKEAPRVKHEPTLEALTHYPSTYSGRRGTRKPGKTEFKARSSRRVAAVSSFQQDIADLRECLRRRDRKIDELNKEARDMRAVRTSQLRESIRGRDAEIARLRLETRALRRTRSIAPTSRIPTFEQWNRCTNPDSFRQAVGRLQNKYSSFCGSVTSYAKALEQLQEARSTLSNAYQDLREQTQMTETQIVDTEKVLNGFSEMLNDLRFNSSAEDVVVICD